MNTGDARTTDLFDDCSGFKPRVDQTRLAETIVRFWSDLQGPSEGSMRLVSGFLIGRRLHGITRKSFCMPDQRESAGVWVAKEASLGRDVYMKPMVNGIDGGRAQMWAIGAEIDRSRLAILPLPSMSLAVTATRVQCYWRLDYAISSAEAEHLVRRLMWSQDRPMVLPGMPDNRGFGAGEFECPECLPLTYSYEDLAVGFPHLKSSGPTWEPGILRPIDLLAQRAGVITAVFGGGALRAGLASAAAAVAAIGGFLIPNPLGEDVTKPQSVASTDLAAPRLPDSNTGPAQLPPASIVTTQAFASPPHPASHSSSKDQSTIRGVLSNTRDEGQAQIQQVQETDEVAKTIGSGAELTREAFERSTGALEGSS